jgi:hypothetical protein
LAALGDELKKKVQCEIQVDQLAGYFSHGEERCESLDLEVMCRSRK